tara:strand:- start:154958 stop:156484 length:1527 start_codon:yes stop_codon:yes gene_type:complete
MKHGLMRGPRRKTTLTGATVAIFLAIYALLAVDRSPQWTFVAIAALAMSVSGLLWLFRSELIDTRLALLSRARLLRDKARQARKLLNNDVLTGLPNRTRFRDYLARLLSSSHHGSSHLAVGILHLHNLETIQDIIDDDAGDELVSKFTEVLRHEVPLYLGYVGPGVFAFVIEDIYDRKTAFAAMQEIMKQVSHDLIVADLPLRIKVIGGLAICPGDADTATAVIQKAKLAMTNAKKTGAQLLLFNQNMAPDLHKLQLVSDLKSTLAAHELKWALQPQYEVSSQRIIGAELLVRWQHPSHGWTPPAEFILWAEQIGIVRQITDAAIEQAGLILRHMKNANRQFQLSVNLSSNDLADTDVVKNIIAQTGGNTEFLTLEITETALMKDMDAVVRNVELLKGTGIDLSLDDYGTGYSSLEYLQAFSFDEIKIDRMFITELIGINRNLALTQASIELAHSLGAIVVAEGVEDKATADLLITMGCDVLQGYYISKPVLLGDLDTYLQRSEQIQL